MESGPEYRGKGRKPKRNLNSRIVALFQASTPVVVVPRSRKIDQEKVLASMDKTCPKCGFTITPDRVKRVDFERMECPKCGESFSAQR